MPTIGTATTHTHTYTYTHIHIHTQSHTHTTNTNITPISSIIPMNSIAHIRTHTTCTIGLGSTGGTCPDSLGDPVCRTYNASLLWLGVVNGFDVVGWYVGTNTTDWPLSELRWDIYSTIRAGGNMLFTLVRKFLA
jgi:hypothetical protein